MLINRAIVAAAGEAVELVHEDIIEGPRPAVFNHPQKVWPVICAG